MPFENKGKPKINRLLNLIALLRTPVGRIQLLYRFFLTCWPIFAYTMILYRKTILRKTKIVVAVGSFGKTTTTTAVGTALKSKVYGFNPRDSWRFASRTFLRPWVFNPYIVLEVRIERRNEMADYARIVRPDIVIATSIGSEHNRSLGTLEVTRSEKAEMVRILPETGIAVLNGDDPNVLWMKSQTRARVITFGMNDMNDVRASDIRLDWPEGTRFKLHLDGKIYDMKVRLIGRHMVYPILAAAAVAHAEGFPPDRFLQSLEDLTPTPGRIQPVHLQNGAIILRDEFKSSLETIETALDVLSEIPAQRKIIVLGEVSEPPGSQGLIYRKIGDRIAKIGAHVIFVGRKRGFANYKSGASRIANVSESLFTYAQKDVLNAVGILHKVLTPGDVVLIKGRGNQRLERVALALTGQTVRCNISFCDAWVRCERCPMLRKGWNGLDVVL